MSCHPGGPLFLSSCRECLAWGVYREHSWLCWSCRWWTQHYETGQCLYCKRTVRIGDQGACRLCVEQSRMLQEEGRAPNLAAANAHGQQLFFANMAFKRHKTARLRPGLNRWGKPGPPPRKFKPSPWEQPTLFDMAPDPDVVRRLAFLENSELTRYCANIVDEHAARFGWSKRQRNDVVRSLRLLQVLRDGPTSKLRASDVLQLPNYDGNVASTIDVLAAAGLLIDDRPRRVEVYFAARAGHLPGPMRSQLETWLLILLDGARNAPRVRQRDPQTIKIRILAITPIVTAWAEAGHTSLAEITAAQVRESLPPSGGRRTLAETGLRSLFKTLKARKLIFADPTRGLPSTPHPGTIPLPLDTQAVRDALNSPDPATALAVAIVAFHALTSMQVRTLRLTDVVDGRMTVGRRNFPLAEPVKVRLTAWLDYRQTVWPNSINPYLFVTRRSASRLIHPGHQFPWRKTTLSPQALREDRILQEAHATGGDIQQLCNLFGLSVDTASRYVVTHQPENDIDAGHAGDLTASAMIST